MGVNKLVRTMETYGLFVALLMICIISFCEYRCVNYLLYIFYTYSERKNPIGKEAKNLQDH